MTQTVAALFVQTNGAYYGLDGVDPWDEKRDARKYRGPWPVVAHPPCQLWVNFAALNYKRYGGEHNRPGNDGGCFYSALVSANQWGGVIEHPAFSNAWEEFNLPRPVKGKWTHDGRCEWWTAEVWQSAYGHQARKRTWLAVRGNGNVSSKPQELNWSRPPGTHQVGWFDRIKPTLSKKQASATPPAFRDMLLSLARAGSNRPH